MLKWEPAPPFQANAKCWPSSERLGVPFAPTLVTAGVTTGATARGPALDLPDWLLYRKNSARTPAINPPRTAFLTLNSHCHGLGRVDAIALDVWTLPMKRYPRRASVSTRMGVSAESPRTSRNLLMAAFRL